MGAERRYYPEPEVKRGPYLEGAVKPAELLPEKSLYSSWVEALRPIGVYETMIVKHFQTHKQAVAAVNYAGGALFARFKTCELDGGKIVVWRYE